MLLQVTTTPTATTKKPQPTSPNHDTSGVSERMIGHDVNMGAVTDKKEGTSMEVTEGGSSEGDVVVGTSAVAELVEEVEEAITPTRAAEAVETEEIAKVNLD